MFGQLTKSEAEKLIISTPVETFFNGVTNNHLLMTLSFSRVSGESIDLSN